jgi:hypothetical protein
MENADFVRLGFAGQMNSPLFGIQKRAHSGVIV